MADYKVIDAEKLDADLTTVADAIRSKGGTSEQLSFPQGMKQAVEAIQSGGGSDEFVGTKLSDFTGGSYGLPKVADIRFISSILSKFPGIDSPSVEQNITGNMFRCYQSNANTGGLYAQLKEVYMCEDLLHFGAYMFCNCTKLDTLHGNLLKIIQIGRNAFENCNSLTSFPYTPSVCIIQAQAFNKCLGLTEFKLYTKPSEANFSVDIDSQAFNGCTNLLDIYVPWSEGEVANAPWGATNATIHYNTTYDENHNPIV